ncbi:MAG: YnbE family lipoprotein [Gammaproteobacteria bacterium]|nr:YnbE family lipoprotein [Gammaproteobacteria bacterium]
MRQLASMNCRHTILFLIVISILLGGCAPTVKVEAPDKPITINLNVKIEHEIRIKVDRELDQLISQEKGLF